MRRWLIWSLVAVVVLVAGVFAGLAIYRDAKYGTRYGESERTLSVASGEVFTLVVPDRGASVGDRWTASVSDGAVVAQVGSVLVADSLADRVFGPAPGGGGGQRLITFRAQNPGTATIVLSNCFQGCANERTRAASREVSWSVTVER
jgi:hypothetical protein